MAPRGMVRKLVNINVKWIYLETFHSTGLSSEKLYMEDRSHKKSYGHMLLNTASVCSTNQTKFGKSITVFFIE